MALCLYRCGSSFAETLVDYEVDPSRDLHLTHQVLNTNWDQDQLTNVVVMFREPRQRLISSYFWVQQHHDQCCFWDWGWRRWERAQMLPSIVAHSYPFKLFTDSYKGCLTKMVLGYKCMDTVTSPKLNDNQIALAKKRMSEFLFIGIQAQWELSMCLFNHIATGHKFVLSKQLQFITPGTPYLTVKKENVDQSHVVIDIVAPNSTLINNNNYNNNNNTSLQKPDYDSELILGSNYKDIADDEIYEYALLLFNEQIEARNITLSSCPMLDFIP
jgi:hypothetical protein